jgi:SAM-dependent methyltransferase
MIHQNIKACYDAVAEAYAAELFDELSRKPLDRILLASFAAENKGKGTLIDLGCGPGQTTRFLADFGIQNILGTDLSAGMVAKAAMLNPDLKFRAADMLNLDFGDGRFGSVVAFYAIVHFNTEDLTKAFNEIYRVLISGGQFLFSFHIGEDLIHRNEFFGKKVDVDFYFFKTEDILELLKRTGFKVVTALERFPYEGIEYPSKRAYLWVEKQV